MTIKKDKGPERPDHEKYTYITKWSEEDGTFVSRVLEFNSLTSEGGSPENAVTKMISLVITVLENMKNRKEEIPEPVSYEQVSRLINRFLERYEIEIHHVEIHKDLYEKGMYINGELEMEGQTALLETWMSDFEDYPLNISKYRRIFHKRNSPVGRCVFHGSGFPETLESLNDIVNNGLEDCNNPVKFADIPVLVKEEVKEEMKGEIKDIRTKNEQPKLDSAFKLFEKEFWDKPNLKARIDEIFAHKKAEEISEYPSISYQDLKGIFKTVEDLEKRIEGVKSGFLLRDSESKNHQ